MTEKSGTYEINLEFDALGYHLLVSAEIQLSNYFDPVDSSSVSFSKLGFQTAYLSKYRSLKSFLELLTSKGITYDIFPGKDKKIHLFLGHSEYNKGSLERKIELELSRIFENQS